MPHSWAEVKDIVDRFRTLNPYSPKLVPGSILKIHKINWDRDKKRRQLFGCRIAAKRYVVYSRPPRRSRHPAGKLQGDYDSEQS
jgi:hypothetical protein